MNETKTFFDSVADTWDSLVEVFPDKIDHIIDVAGIRTGDNVLDVGTGTGVMIPYLSRAVGAAGSVIGIDISEGMLRNARAKYGSLGNVSFKITDVENDPIVEEYDRIMMYCMYPHLENPLDTLKWLVQLNLRPGGTLTIAHPQSRMSINSIHRHNDGSVHSDHLIEASAFISQLEALGLTVDYAEDTDEYYIIRLRK